VEQNPLHPLFPLLKKVEQKIEKLEANPLLKKVEQNPE
jgi:hypothetical protein